MSIRTEIIKAMFEKFIIAKKPTADTQYPMQIETVADAWRDPVNVVDISPKITPFVSFGYGDTRPGQPGLTQEEIAIFSMFIYGVVQDADYVTAYDIPSWVVDTVSNPNERIRLPRIADRMESLMEHIARELNAFQIATDNQVVQRVRLGQTRSAAGKFTSFEYMQFRFDFTISTEYYDPFG